MLSNETYYFLLLLTGKDMINDRMENIIKNLNYLATHNGNIVNSFADYDFCINQLVYYSKI